MADYKSQQINRGSISDILQLLKGFSSGHERKKNDLNNQFTLYEGLIKAASNSEMLENLKPGLQRFNRENNAYEEFEGLDDYLDNTINQKLRITKKAEDSYGRRIARQDMLQAGINILNVFPITKNKKENNNDWN